MTAKVLESFGGKFAEQWVAAILTPAFAFWLGGLIAIIQRYSWQSLVARFTQTPEPLQIAILVGCLCVVATSAFVVQRFDLATLRFLEGYGSLWPPALRRWRVSQYRKRRDRISQQIQTLRAIENEQQSKFQTLKIRIENAGVDTLSLDERNQYLQLNKQFLTSTQQANLIQLGQELRTIPTIPDLMPTRLGNLLRAAERKPLEKYGLDAVVCWPRLWLLLPDAVKKDLQEARSDLNTAARVWLWSMLFCGWAILAGWPPNITALWPLPLGLFSAAFAYYSWAIHAAGTYGDLIESTFDLYRPLLYQSLRWPLPNSPQEERELGEALTRYLWRGSEGNYPAFTPPK